VPVARSIVTIPSSVALGITPPAIGLTCDSMDKMYRQVNFEARIMPMGEPHLLFDVAGCITRLTLNPPDQRNVPALAGR
jgi:hypothetical protein